ncbi:MAG: polysaccharide pyruvyl transferase family protein [Candidatus Cloacimonas sp.]
MIIEIRKAGFVNKGAHLMVLAILDKLKERYPSAKFSIVTNGSSQALKEMMKLGLYPKAYLFRKLSIMLGDLASLIPKKLWSRYGIVMDKEVDVVIDAAGFAYGDKWGRKSVYELYRSSIRWKRRGVKTILLPQAFGPFTLLQNQLFLKKALKNLDLVYAREEESYKHIVEITGESSHLKIAPDFTNLISGKIPSYFVPQPNLFCIVPNYRMIDKTDSDTSAIYLSFMKTCARYLEARGVNLMILIHEGEKDLYLGREISRSTEKEIPIIQETDPIFIKGILGSCTGTIGSRYHGLVSALSQGVPSLATGWSHKYEMLLKDYDFDEGLLDVHSDDKQLSEKLDMIIDKQRNKQLSEKLLKKSEELKKKVELMWLDVFSIIDEHQKIVEGKNVK